MRGMSQQDANLNGRAVRITRQSGAPILIRVSCERVILSSVTCEVFQSGRTNMDDAKKDQENTGMPADVADVADAWAAVFLDLSVKTDSAGEGDIVDKD